MTADAPTRTRTRPLRTDHSTAPTRAALRAAGPLAVLSLIVFALALVLTGGDELALAVSPVGMASSLLGLASLIALVLGLVALHGRPELQRGAGAVGWTVAMIGTVMTAGGQWTQLFLLPGLAGPAPELASGGIGTLIAGYIASFVVLGAGWVMLGIALLRARGVSRGIAWAVIIGGLVCIAPLPARFVVVAVAASLLSRRDLGARGKALSADAGEVPESTPR